MPTDKRLTSYRLTDEAREMVRLLAERLGISQTDVMEMAVRQLAQAKLQVPDIGWPPTEKPKEQS